MALPRLSPSAYQRITFLALVALGFIVVTGGAVRLTGSGLGCSDWPTCEENRLVAPFEYHAMVEFVNRTITGIVSVAVILAVLGALVRVPRRRDLIWWSLGLVAGVIGQIVLGGITVLFELAPPFVMGHFVLSMVLIWDGVVPHHLAGGPAPPARPVVSNEVRWLGRLLVVAATLVILLGTVVTGAGPHGGDADVERLPYVVGEVARLHGIAVMLFGALTVATLWIVRGSATADVMRRGEVLLGVLVAQAAVGYAQYFTGVPVGLVAIHIFGAVAVWIATLVFVLRLHTHPPPADDLDPAHHEPRTVTVVG